MNAPHSLINNPAYIQSFPSKLTPITTDWTTYKPIEDDYDDDDDDEDLTPYDKYTPHKRVIHSRRAKALRPSWAGNKHSPRKKRKQPIVKKNPLPIKWESD